MSQYAIRLYHASPVQSLTRLVPHVGTHGQSWVYATDDPAVAAVFLGRLGGDFTCASGIYQGMPYLCERFAGAFELRYGSVRGSIYVVPGENFQEGRTSYSKDFVCPEAVEPLGEIRVDNAKDYLLHLASEGKMMVKFYPERFCIAEDDQDLVEKAVRMYRQSGEGVLEQVKDFHPQLLGRVMEACQRGAPKTYHVLQTADELKPRRPPPAGKTSMQMIPGAVAGGRNDRTTSGTAQGAGVMPDDEPTKDQITSLL